MYLVQEILNKMCRYVAPQKASGTKSFVIRDGPRIVKETDDWVEAAVIEMNAFYKEYPRRMLKIEGVHPTHIMAEDRCVICTAPSYQCHMSQAPCGYTFGESWVNIITREMKKRGIFWSTRRI